MGREIHIQKDIMLHCGSGDSRLFRNNVGMLEDKNGNKVRYGLCNGSSDLIGFTSIEITPDMVGQKVAVFTALEVKRPGKQPTDDQVNFIEVVRRAGGRAGVARCREDAEKIQHGVLPEDS